MGAVNRLLETHFPTLFHTASALSAPSGHLPLEGKAIYIKRRSRHCTPEPRTSNPEPSFLCCLSIYLYAKIRYYSELSIYGVKKPIEWVVYISQEI